MIKNEKKITPASLWGIAVGVLVAVLIFRGCNTSDKSDELAIKSDLVAYSKTLPQRIDEVTVLDSLLMPTDKVLRYCYTIAIYKEDADTASIQENVNTYILSTIKTSPDLALFRNLEYTWDYVYYDLNGQFFHEYIVTPDMYK